MHDEVQELLDRLGVRLDAERPVRGLSIADQQIVEIAKALSFDARVLIMDEPTAALSGPEVERLFGVVRTLRDRGAAVLFISHRLEEVFALCDTVTIMRDGEVVHDAATAEHHARRGRAADGRPRAVGAVPQGGHGDRRGGAARPPAHARGRVHRHQLRGPRGRDRRARGARRRRPQRGRAGDLRHRPRRRGPRRGRRQPAARRPPPTAAMRAGHRLRPRGPPPAGARHGALGRAQRDAHPDGRAARAAASSAAAPSARLAARLGDAAAAQVPPARRPGRVPLGRQPAEGRAREVAGDRAEGAHRRRADARHRRRHEGRGPPPALASSPGAASPC